MKVDMKLYTPHPDGGFVDVGRMKLEGFVLVEEDTIKEIIRLIDDAFCHDPMGQDALNALGADIKRTLGV